MSNTLSPETMARLQQLGWAPPMSPSAPANPMPQAPPGATPPAQAASPPPSRIPQPVTPGARPGVPGYAPPQPSSSPRAQFIASQGSITPPKAHGVFDEGASGGAAPNSTLVPAHALSRVSPGVRSEFDSALAGERQGAEELGRAEVSANEKGADATDAMAVKTANNAAIEQAHNQERHDALNGQAEEYKRLQQEAASGKVDSNAWWGSRSGGQKALALVSIGLGQFGASMKGGNGNNVALQMINDHIAKNIDDQKESLANKHRSADAAGSLYKAKMAQFQDEHAAELATHATMLEQYKLTAQAEAQRAQSPVLAARTKELVAGLSLKQAEIHKDLEVWLQAGKRVSEAEIAKEAQAIGEAEANRGKPITPEEARSLALRFHAAGTGTGGLTGKGAPGAVDAGDVAGTAGKSTSALENPLNLISRQFSSTEAGQAQLANEQQNAPILGYVHKAFGARTPEAQEHIAAPFLRQPGDSQERLEQKHRGLLKMLAAAKKGAYSGDPGDYLDDDVEAEK